MLRIDPDSYVPPFEQLRLQFLDAVTSGALRPGDRLPTVRKLAGDLGIATNTVARAYRELEQAGVVETRGRHGTYVVHDPSASDKAGEFPAPAHAAAEVFTQQMRHLGIGSDQAADLLRDHWGVHLESTGSALLVDQQRSTC